jgi:hypothetical protein
MKKIQSIKFHDTAEMTVVHPVDDTDLVADDGTPMTVVIYGAQSKVFKAARNAGVNASVTKRGKQVSAEKMEDNAAQLLADCTVSFNGVDFGDGLIDVKDAKEAYLEHSWFKEQVDIFAGSNANFLVESKKR